MSKQLAMQTARSGLFHYPLQTAPELALRAFEGEHESGAADRETEVSEAAECRIPAPLPGIWRLASSRVEQRVFAWAHQCKGGQAEDGTE